MTFIDFFFQFIKILLEIINNFIFIIFFTLLIFLYHLIAYLIRDCIYLKAVNINEDPDQIKINDLNYIPLINVIVPAWKEGEEFKDLLESITKLSYPSIQVIVNAGGNQETIDIANSFKKYKNFIILYQIGGKKSAALGKIKALNECLNYVSEGILYLIDADCFLTDELILRMVSPLINGNESVVIGAGIRPLKSQENIDLVKYLEINVNRFFDEKFSRYYKIISGANTCVTYGVIKKIGKFNENRFIAEDVSRAIDIKSKGFKIYSLVDYRSRIYTDFPKNFKEFFQQKKRQVQNSFLFSYRNKKISYILKFFVLNLLSFYIIILPILLIYNFGLFFLGIGILLFIYIKKIRKNLFFKASTNQKYYLKFRKRFFIKILFYIYVEMIYNFIILFTLISHRSYLKKEKINSFNFKNEVMLSN